MTTWMVVVHGKDEADTTSDNNINNVNQCGLYMAPSSTQESSDDDSSTTTTVWGLYAGKEIRTGQTVGPAEVAINLWHFRANSVFSVTTAEDEEEEENEEAAKLQAMVDFVESYIWVPGPIGARFEQDVGRMVSAVPGAGVLSAFDMKLTNANWDHLAAYSRPAWNTQSGVSHPGRGAQSDFYAATITATADIAQGSEIFMDYGENWAEEEKREALVLEDYKNLDLTVNKMIAFFDKHTDLHPEAQDQIYKFLTKDVMVAAVGSHKAKTVEALLPDSVEGLKEIPAKGGILVHAAPRVYRQVDWLEENAFCVDYMRPGPSTLPHAGRGAFAARKIKAGTVVTASPLVQIPDVSILDLHPVEEHEDEEEEIEYVRSSHEVTGKQLLLNYCYGHPESSMVFFPAGPMASMINHNGQSPNVKLQWSKHETHKSDWLQVDPDELIDDPYAYLGLVMEVVALRDIEEDEEIFLDYGKDWQAAWDSHVAAFDQTNKEWPVRAVDMNAMYKTKPFETIADLGKDPEYPDNVKLKAFLMIEESLHSGLRDDPKAWSEPEGGTAYDADNIFDMIVESKKQVGTSEDGVEIFEYLVRWTNNKGVPTFVENVPHDALIFVDAPGESDQYAVDKPFRHVIGIPDDIFPQGPWRNLK